MTIHRKKPADMAVNFDNIPDPLKRLANWVMWSWKEEQDKNGNTKFGKPPLTRAGSLASSTNPATWCTYAQAKEAYATGRFSGVGVAFGQEGIGLIGIDFDGCRDAETGVIKPEVQAIVDQLGTFFEVSPSMTGIKGFVRGNYDQTLFNSKVKDETLGDIEVYQSRRYFTVTSHCIGKKEIADSGPAFAEFMNKYLAKEVKPSDERKTVESSEDVKGIPLAISAMSKVEVDEDEGDGSRRLVKYARQCIRYGLSPDSTVKAIRMMELVCPFPVKWSVEQIKARYASALLQSEVGEAIERQKASRVDPADIAIAIKSATPLYSRNGQLYEWDGGGYALVKDPSSFVRRVMHPKYSHITGSVVSNVLPHLIWMTESKGVWAPKAKNPWPEESCFATRNEILYLDLVSQFREREEYSQPITPDYLSTNSVGYDFVHDDPGCPVWKSFIGGLWPDSPESIRLLRQWFGYCLTDSNLYHKMLWLYGVTRSGKGVIAETLRALIGESNVCAPTLNGLSANFGISPFLDARLAIVGDARISAKADQATITERLLSISSGDLLTIDRKYESPISVRLQTRIMILSNELPRLVDASNALAGRFLILKTTISHKDKEDTELALKLRSELPGILHWAIGGLHDLRKAKRFIEPPTSKDDRSQIEQLSSPVSAFIEDECELATGKDIACQDLFLKWKEWAFKHNYHPGTSGTFGRDFNAAAPSVTRYRVPKAEPGQKTRGYIYSGICLSNVLDNVLDSEAEKALFF